MNPRIIAVHKDTNHNFSKNSCSHLRLLQGLGVEGDAHCGVTVKHRSRVALDPSQPNLRQVHLLHAELFDELAPQGFQLSPGVMGENITTRGIDLLALPVGSKLHLGTQVIVELTGLRNPCAQIENFQAGLLSAVLDFGPGGELIRKAGVMAIVLVSGVVSPDDTIKIVLPEGEHRALERV